MLTGPLPEQVDHRKLVKDRARLQGTIPLHRFLRLVQSLESDAGEVQAKLEFRRSSQRTASVIATASVNTSLICQSCLGEVNYLLDVRVQLTLVDSDEGLLELDQDEDGFVVADQLVPLVDLLEDELILDLPMVPRHQTDDCQGELAQVASTKAGKAEVVIKEGTYRPFAGLSRRQDK